MALRHSAPRPAKGSPGAAKLPKPLHTIVALEDIQAWPLRTDGSVMMYGDFVMKSGCKMEQFYGTASKFDGSYESDGEEDAQSVAHKAVIEHPGDEVASEDFAQNWLGVPCIIISDFCDGSPKRVIGTDCAPVQMKLGFTQTADKTGFTFTFEAFAKTNWLPGRYTGNIILAAPYDVPDPEAIVFSPSNGTQYKLPADAAGAAIAADSITLPAGTIVTLHGSGGTDPSTLSASATVLLTSGWTALDGAFISLEVYESNSTMYLIERNRG